MSAGRRSSNKALVSIAFCVAGIAIGCYVNTLSGKFVMDDTAAVVNNADVSPTSSVWDLFRNDYWGDPLSSHRSHKSYRPLTVISFRLNNLRGQLQPWAFHATNVILHGVASALVTIMAAIVVQLTLVEAACAGLLFAAHPVHVEAVANVVGRAELLACICFALALLSYVQALKNEHQWLTHIQLVAVAALLVLAATLCKEQGITVVAVMTVLDCTWPWQCVPMPGTSSGTLRRRILRLATLWTLVLSALVVRLWATETSFGPTFSFVDNPIAYANSSSTRCLSLAHVHAQYARLLVFPAFLACDYSFDAVPLVTSFSDLRNVWSALVYVTMTGLAVAAVRRKDAALAVSLAILVAPFVPASNVFFYVATTIAERVLYIPSAGLCVGAVLLAGRMRVPRVAKHAVFGLILALAVERTWQRNFDWADNVTLFTADVGSQPRSSKLHVCLATAYLDNGDLHGAIKLGEAALAIHPTYAGAHYVIGLAYDRLGKRARARKHYKKAIRLGHTTEFLPDVVFTATNNLGITYMKAGDMESLARAEELFRKALQLEPQRVSVLSNLAETLKMQRRYAEAIPYYEASIRASEDANAHNNLGMALFEARGMPALEEAANHYARALELDPGHVAALDNAARVYSHWKMFHKEIPLLRRLARLRPGDAEVEYRLRTAMRGRRAGSGQRAQPRGT